MRSLKVITVKAILLVDVARAVRLRKCEIADLLGYLREATFFYNGDIATSQKAFNRLNEFVCNNTRDSGDWQKRIRQCTPVVGRVLREDYFRNLIAA